MTAAQANEISFESLEYFECAMCLEPLIDRRPLMIKCKHTFCRDCLREWTQQCYADNNIPTCPTCRAPYALKQACEIADAWNID